MEGEQEAVSHVNRNSFDILSENDQTGTFTVVIRSMSLFPLCRSRIKNWGVSERALAPSFLWQSRWKTLMLGRPSSLVTPLVFRLFVALVP
jgi:hypothetical protein